jgi:hypothetical protein
MEAKLGRMLLVAILSLLGLAAVGGQSIPDISLLNGSLWTEIEPLADGVPGPRLALDTLRERNKQRALDYFSAMIYGYHFVYVPGDQGRQVADSFELKPRARIAADSPGLELDHGSYQNNTYVSNFRYRTTALEQRSLRVWNHPNVPNSGGIGHVSYHQDGDGPALALEAAAKEAVRAYGRAITRNKPRRMEGSLALVRFPYITIDNGRWFANVAVRIVLRDLEQYRNY